MESRKVVTLSREEIFYKNVEKKDKNIIKIWMTHER